MKFTDRLKHRHAVKKENKHIAICVAGLVDQFTNPWWLKFSNNPNVTLFGCSANDVVENTDMHVFVSKKESNYLSSITEIYERKKVYGQPIRKVSCDETTAAKAFGIYCSLFEKKKWELQHGIQFDMVIFSSPDNEINEIPDHPLEMDCVYSAVKEEFELCTSSMNANYFYGTSNAMNHSSMFFKYLSIMDHDSIYAPFLDKSVVKDYNDPLPMGLLMFNHHMMTRIKVLDAV